MNAAIHGIILAFGLILPLGAQNVLIFQQGAASRAFGGLCRLSSPHRCAIPS
ncbi:hypothetical protein CHCC20442_2554 [Bacillus licheniformis]|nr:hypothetical protein CHCC20442_2554 [Bacillus licheniformis]